MSLENPPARHAPSTAVRAPSQVRAWTVTAVVVCASVVVFLDKAVVGLVASPVQKEFTLSATAFGAISSASYLLLVVTCLTLGVLSDRFSPRVLLLACGVMWGLGQVPAVLATTAVMLVGSRLAVGAAEGPVVPLMHTIAYSWFPNDRRGLPASLITGGAAVAKIALLPVMTVIVVGYGWRSGFLTVGILALAWSLVWRGVGRMGPYTVQEPQPQPRPAAGRPSPAWRRLLGNRTFLAAALAYFAQNALASVIFTWLPSYFQHGLGLSETASGLLFSLPSALGIVALVLTGAFTDRRLARGGNSRRVRGLTGGAIEALAGCFLVLLPWIPSVLPAITLLVLGYGLSVTVGTFTLPAVAEITPAEHRGRVLAVLSAIGGVAGVVSPLLTGVILDRSSTAKAGYDLAFLVFGGFMVLGGLVFAALADPVRDAPRHLP